MTEQYIIRSRTNGRENNEDSFLVFTLTPPGGGAIPVLALADGMGGHEHGEHVSREGLRKVALSLFEELCVQPGLNQRRPAPVTLEQMTGFLWAAIQQANHHVRRMIEQNGWPRAGSTIVLAALLGHKLVVTNLGDSPALLYRADRSELLKLTTDHTIAGALLQADLITAEMARHHEGRSRLEFFLGADTLPRTAPVRWSALTPDDMLLICSDGVSGALSVEQIQHILADPASTLAQKADHLLDTARVLGETDNQTLILWRYHGSPPPTPASHSTIMG